MGKLVSFEGIDGAGKTTVIDYVEKKLKNKGYRVNRFQEPGSTPIGLQIRKLLKSDIPKSKLTILYLLEASRADLVQRFLKPALNNNDFVLIDRYIDSSVAYQGYGDGISIDIIQQLNKIAIQDMFPEYRFLIDIDLKTASQRRNQRHQPHDFFDTHLDFAKRVLNGYYQLVKQGILFDIWNDSSIETADDIIHYLI